MPLDTGNNGSWQRGLRVVNRVKATSAEGLLRVMIATGLLPDAQSVCWLEGRGADCYDGETAGAADCGRRCLWKTRSFCEGCWRPVTGCDGIPRDLLTAAGGGEDERAAVYRLRR